MNIAFKYTLFAIAAILTNVLLQSITFWIYRGFLSLYVAMFFGTLGGLWLKYVFDKKYIFYHKPLDKKDDLRKFLLYTSMGIFTTLIFWSLEIGFDYCFNDERAKYVGLVIGLVMGYAVKYILDKTFVFK